MTDELEKAINSVGRYLAARDHSEHELRTKLSRRYSEEIVDQAVNTALERNWLAEPEKLARQLTEELSRKHKSHRYIEAQLFKRGLPVLEGETEAELEKLRELTQKKFGENLSFEDKTKAFRFLKYRGFEDALIHKVLYEKLDE